MKRNRKNSNFDHFSLYSNQDICLNDGYTLKPKSLYSWCTRVLYNRRTKFDPLWNRLVIGGVQDGQT